MKKQTTFAIGLLSTIVLSGCTTEPVVTANQEMASQPAMIEPQKAVVKTVTTEVTKTTTPEIKVDNAQQSTSNQSSFPKLIKITGIGYGAESTFEGYTPGQRRLMAIRSAKLDAYRALAEQLYGIKIDSNTSVSTLTAKNDSFRARVNAIVRGARVVSITPMADRNYETVLEVYVDQEFFNSAFVYTQSSKNDQTSLTAPSLTDGLTSGGFAASQSSGE